MEVLCKNLGAQKIIKAARKPKHNEVLFSDSNKYKTANVVINATPSGMYPNNYDEMLIDLEQIAGLEAVVDLVYNPLETKLVSKAKSLNILGVNGLMMLVSQAVQSCELFHNQTYKKEVIINIYKEILFNMMNIIIIGMPMSGKSFYARALSKSFNKEITDIDEEIHHIDYNKKNNLFTNLVPLCKVCHGKTNYDRKTWQKIFEEKLTKK